MRRGFFKSKKFKYGSLATAFTAAFVAFVVIFNIIFTALADKYMWRIDMTNEQVFTLSEDAKDILSDITEEVNIYFASEPDVLLTGNYSGFTRYVYTTALQIEEAFPNIHVHCENVEKNPEFFREFYNTTASIIDPNSVILESGGEVRVFSITAFYMYNDTSDLSTVWAYNGEKRLISGIMQVTQTETPKVTFTTEHGEDINNALSMATVFAENGYEVETLDLATQDISPDCRVMVIYNPIYDFIGAEAEDSAKNEIEKLDKFLDNYGCLIVLCDPEHVGNLRNLNEFLEEWGISYMANTTVRDMDHSMSVDGYTIITEYQPDTMGGSIYTDLNALATPPKTLIRSAAPIEILWEMNETLTGTRIASAVLKSSDTSELMVNGVPTAKGSYNVMTVTRESKIVENEYYYSYVMAVGSPSFTYDGYIDSDAFANEDIVAAAMKATGRERVLAVLNYKPFDNSEIIITTKQAQNLTLSVTLIIPVIVMICGAVVLIRRKHS
jgi:hypothetical protein